MSSAQEQKGSESDTYTDGVCVLLRRKMDKIRRASCPGLDLTSVQQGKHTDTHQNKLINTISPLLALTHLEIKITKTDARTM